MRFLLLLTVVVVCTATTLHRTKNINFNKDGTIEISGPYGKRILIDRTKGPKNIELEVGGPRMMKKIRIGDRSSEEGSDEEFGQGRSQGDVLVEIFKDYIGNVGEVEFNQLLERVDEAVRRGELNPRVRYLLEKFEQDRSSEEDEEEEDNRERLFDKWQQQQQLVRIANHLRRLQQIQQQQPMTDINGQLQMQQQFANVINFLQQQIQLKQLKLNQECGRVGGGLTLAEQQQIWDILNLLRQQQQLQFQQVQIIPGLTPWQQQQQISNCINRLEELLQQHQQCQQFGRFGGSTRWQQQQEQRRLGKLEGSTPWQQAVQQRSLQELLEQPREFLGLTPWQRQQEQEKENLRRFRQIGGLTPWQQQQQQIERARQIEQLLEQKETGGFRQTPWQLQARMHQMLEQERQGRVGGRTPWQQMMEQQRIQRLLEEQQQQPMMIGMTRNVEPLQGFMDTDGLTQIVGARVGDEAVFHTLPSRNRRPSLMDLMGGQMRQRELLGTPQFTPEHRFY